MIGRFYNGDASENRSTRGNEVGYTQREAKDALNPKRQRKGPLERSVKVIFAWRPLGLCAASSPLFCSAYSWNSANTSAGSNYCIMNSGRYHKLADSLRSYPGMKKNKQLRLKKTTVYISAVFFFFQGRPSGCSVENSSIMETGLNTRTLTNRTLPLLP